MATIVVRGSTQNTLDDLERTVHDGVSVIKAMGSDPRFVAGGGAAEMELALALQRLGATQPGLDQYAVNKFAEALEVVARVLAENGGHDATDVVANMYAAHQEGRKTAGVDIDTGKIEDMASRGVLDLLSTKAQAFKLAADAAITVLRVDHIIMAKQAGGAKQPPPPGGGED